MDLLTTRLMDAITDIATKIQENNTFEYPDNKDLVSLLKEDLCNYLIFLSTTDGCISEDEVDFITAISGHNYTSEKIIVNLSTKTANDYISTIPISLTYFLKTSNISGTFFNGKYFSIFSLYLYTYEVVGHSFIACNNDLNLNEISFLTRYTMNLNTYIQKNKPASPIPVSGDVQLDSSNTTNPNDLIPINYDGPLISLVSELNELTGLASAKSDLLDIIHLLKVNSLRVSRGLTPAFVPMHYVFLGNLVSEKTLIVDYLSQIYQHFNIISQDKITKASISDFIGIDSSDTLSKIKIIIEKSQPGILFLEDLHTLSTDFVDNVGDSLLTFLIRELSEVSSQLITILSGPTKELTIFLEDNPLVSQLFIKNIYFEDYTLEEITEIIFSKATKNDYHFDNEATFYLQKQIASYVAENTNAYSNMSFFQSLLDNIFSKQAERIMHLPAVDTHILQTITLEDVIAGTL